jgi:squalene-hopene/tetraprenyl-beta-curcumene cyclase
MVCRALEVMPSTEQTESMWREGLDWLYRNQNPDGGWGGGSGTPSSIEETALAITALAGDTRSERESVIKSGIQWLVKETKNGTKFPSSPIGFYFAKLWYFERIYPLVWTVEAVNRCSAE